MNNKIFVHIPKTAGSTIIYHKNQIGISEVIYHCPIKENNKININKLRFINSQFYKTNYSFSFVRNPYDRVISAYNYLYNGGTHKGIDIEYNKMLRKYVSFENFINDLHELKYKIVHLIPQYLFICDDSDNIIVNFVGKYENFEHDILSISTCKNIQFKVINKSRTVIRDITNEMKEIIYKEYEKDFVIFGYDK